MAHPRRPGVNKRGKAHPAPGRGSQSVLTPPPQRLLAAAGALHPRLKDVAGPDPRDAEGPQRRLHRRRRARGRARGRASELPRPSGAVSPPPRRDEPKPNARAPPRDDGSGPRGRWRPARPRRPRPGANAWRRPGSLRPASEWGGTGATCTGLTLAARASSWDHLTLQIRLEAQSPRSQRLLI